MSLNVSLIPTQAVILQPSCFLTLMRKVVRMQFSCKVQTFHHPYFQYWIVMRPFQLQHSLASPLLVTFSVLLKWSLEYIYSSDFFTIPILLPVVNKHHLKPKPHLSSQKHLHPHPYQPYQGNLQCTHTEFLVPPKIYHTSPWILPVKYLWRLLMCLKSHSLKESWDWSTSNDNWSHALFLWVIHWVNQLNTGV